MGLDIVEFVMAVEDAVGIRIPNDAAMTITTPRMLVNYLHEQLPQCLESHCLAQRAFYRIRKALADRLNVSHTKLRPRTELSAILPAKTGSAAWTEVGERLGFSNWPRPRGSGWFARNLLHGRPRTLGDAARYVDTFTPSALKPPGEGWAWCEVAAVVDGQMRYHLAIRDYSLDDRFAEDLGVD